MVEFRPINNVKDREFILEARILARFENDTPWARSPGLPSYRRWWLSTRQSDRFMRLLARSLRDKRTIAEIINVDGVDTGFVWATFVDVPESAFTYVELNELAFRPEWQRHGLGRLTIAHVEEVALERGADAIRSFSGVESLASNKLHISTGFVPIETRYEKLLKPRGIIEEELGAL
jgi:GNAT superfamily N-acetyltransferase